MLGESLRRRRVGRAGRAGRARPAGPGARGNGLRWVLAAAAVGVVGFSLGYACAVTVLFPGGEPMESFITVPNLSRLTVPAAQELLAGSQLALAEVDTLTHPSIPVGEILAQGPLPGQLTLPGRAVRVTVSGGPDLRTVPDVRQLPRRAAETILETSGFTVQTDTVYADAEPGRVVSVSPEAGREVALPYDVRIQVSLGPAQVELSLLLTLPLEAALATLDSLGLTVSEIERRPWAGAVPGTVIGQEPAAGTLLDRGAAVRLIVVGEPPEARNFPRGDP
ncbi:MAG: PASTA domain-containing protein [Gemmatimonadetes bacterium]|nr:PASTA domain-containing protein [Gemmatimonadota bacterium]